mmetsp:Transcript_685/g.1202  ORF Transcript_685/g.1202 Transcript_685/m.1202 type:complete len:772 (+) Transcript_685:336-2651(+)
MSSRESTQSPSAYFMHNFPRFGHGSKFSKLASQDQSEQTDYVVGLLAVSYFIISVFIMWAAAIIALRCLGPRRATFFAGRIRIKSDKSESFRLPRYIWKLRCLFMVLGISVILCSVALVGPGMTSIDNVAYSARKLNRDISDITTQGLLITDSISRAKTNLERLNVDQLMDVGSKCPVFLNNSVVSNESLTTIMTEIKSEIDSLKDYMEENDFNGVQDQIRSVMDGSEILEIAATLFEENDWIARMYAVVLDGIVFFMIISSCITLSGKNPPALKFMNMFFILPAFVILIIGSWFMTSFIATAAISNADICVGEADPGSPEHTVTNILREMGIEEDGMIFTTFLYYRNGCAATDPIGHFYQYEDHIQSGIESANKFLDQTDEIGTHAITEKCGRDAIQIVEGIGVVKDNLGILLNALRSTFEVASCARISPLFRQIFQGAPCSTSVEGLTMIFWVMLSISVIGMLMILIRAALFPCKEVCIWTEDFIDENDEWEEYQAYLRYMAEYFNIWGDQAAEADVLDIKESKDTSETSSYETASFNSKNCQQSQSNIHLDEEQPMTPPKNATSNNGSTHIMNSPDHFDFVQLTSPSSHKYESPVNSYRTAQQLEHLFVSGETNIEIGLEQNPLMNAIIQSPAHSIQFSPTASESDHCDDSDDELQPLTPQTPQIPSLVHRRTPRIERDGRRMTPNERFLTPSFLSPGTFHKWRQHDDDEMIDRLARDHSIPSSLSPTNNKDQNAFSRSDDVSTRLSPLKSRRIAISDTDGSTKNKIV